MSWKFDDNGNIVMKDGNPVYVDSNGDEKTVAVDTISRLNREAKDHREAKEAALAKLKAFDGLDAAKAREALEKVSKYEHQIKLDEGKLDEVKTAITTQYEAQLDEKTKALTELQTRFDNMLISNVFANSDFIRDNVAIPRDMFEATFRHNFRVEDGKVTVYDNDGNRLYSKERSGEPATPEEGLRILTEARADRDSILRANVGSGSGNSGRGGGNGGGRYLKRSDYEKLPASEKLEYAKKISKGEMVLTDG